jgi:hypothetical protein
MWDGIPVWEQQLIKIDSLFGSLERCLMGVEPMESPYGDKT